MKSKVYYKDGTCFEGKWYFQDPFKIIHREDGPAIEYEDGTKRWYQNGKLHREDGPAIEWKNKDEDKYWYLDDLKYTKQEYFDFLKEIDSLKPMIGLTDPREWVRKRWKNKLTNSE